MSEPVHIDPGESQLLISAGDTIEYLAQLAGADVVVAENEHDAEAERGMQRVAGDEGPLEAAPNTEVYAYNTGDQPAEVRMTPRREQGLFNTSNDGIRWERLPRAIVGAVRTSSGNEASPSNDEDVWFADINADPSAGISHSFRSPDAAESVVVSVDDADNSFEVAVIFEDADGNEITRRDSGNSGTYSGNSSTDVFAETVVASEFVTVEITGAATSADYSIYAR